jgi:hypothetical protein
MRTIQPFIFIKNILTGFKKQYPPKIYFYPRISAYFTHIYFIIELTKVFLVYYDHRSAAAAGSEPSKRMKHSGTSAPGRDFTPHPASGHTSGSPDASIAGARNQIWRIVVLTEAQYFF